MFTIYAVSDGTADTAERLAQAATTQFVEASTTVVRRDHVRTMRQVRAVVEEAGAGDSIILHTFVSNDLRATMLEETRLHDVDSFDALGPVLERLASHLELPPRELPGLLKQLATTKSRSIDAVEYAFRHDDGQNVSELDRAEVVLVGASRNMKTPIMLYMAYRGWFAANVPIVMGIDLPKELLRFPPKRVFCLTMSTTQLQELRRVRAKLQGIPLEPYTSAEFIRKEVFYCRELARSHGWWHIHVGAKSVEEVCREIIALLPEKELPENGS